MAVAHRCMKCHRGLVCGGNHRIDLTVALAPERFLQGGIEFFADALAAGNTAIIKPSAYAPATGRIIEKIVTECFPEELAAVPVRLGVKEQVAVEPAEENLLLIE